MTPLFLSANNIHKGNLILVNAAHPLAQEYRVELLPADEKYADICMERGAATVLSHVLQGLKGTQKIVPVSGYRTVAEQSKIYADSLKTHGEAFTRQYVALPQCSEHQTGYAIDLALEKNTIDFIRPDFPYEGICEEFRKNAPKAGFIERYQKGKVAITRIAHEPWHFRFVGYPHSLLMAQRSLSLEEYCALLKEHPQDAPLRHKSGKGTVEIFYVPLCESARGKTQVLVHSLYQVSGNNVDGAIVTMWRQ